MDPASVPPHSTGRERPLRLLMELRPCFDGYAGIPQEVRLLFANLARSPDVVLGGLLDGGDTSGRLPPAADAGATTARFLFSQTTQVIALDADAAPSGAQKILSGGLRQLLFSGPFRRLDLLSRWGSRDPLAGSIDPRLFGDWLWTRLFQKSLPAADRPLLERTVFPVPRMTWRDAARLAAVSAKARPQVDLGAAGWDIHLAHTPCPYRLVGGKLVVRYHDAVPLLWPHTVGHALAHAHSHFRMLEANVAEGAWFVCDSEPSREDLLRFFPQAEPRTEVIPVLSPPMSAAAPRPPADIAEIMERCRAPGHARVAADAAPLGEAAAEPFVLAVSTLEPRKNYGMLMRAFGAARRAGARLKLVVVANPGWRSEAEMSQLGRLVAQGSAFHLSNVPVRDLEALYSAAHAVVCPSRAEGFDLATTEAMACGAPVLASDIPVHRWVCGDAADYFDPYDEDALALLLAGVAGERRGEGRGEGRLALLRERGLRQAAGYRSDVLMPKWHRVFDKVLAG